MRKNGEKEPFSIEKTMDYRYNSRFARMGLWMGLITGERGQLLTIKIANSQAVKLTRADFMSWFTALDLVLT